jgi:cytochrome c oxidase subunit 4
MIARISKRTYSFVWLWLVVLLLATLGFSQIDLKAFNLPLALSISFAKMLLIVLFFMHARYSKALIWVIAGAGVAWLLIFIDLTLSDYLTRGLAWPQ